MPAIRKITGKPWTSPPLGLITMAALLPDHWDIRLIDHNIDPLTDADIEWADLIMTGGMIPQRVDSLEIIKRTRALGKPVAVGGPDISSSPHVFAEADFRILGEAESVADEFIAAWENGERGFTVKAEPHKTDITASPVPRFDLLQIDKYISLCVQFSRGCPFTCEFCDIIELFGRVPRTKTPEQMLREFDAIYDLGYRGVVFLVDDNLIGNKKAVKAFLPHLIAWQREHGYPFQCYTEASINLADDPELMKLMRDANINLVFIGIETPDSDTLVAMRKKQNTRRDLAASVNAIYAAGIQVHAGYIIGFDSEPDTIAEDMIACIEATSVPVNMVGLLTALPDTQLSRRLVREERLDPETDLDFVQMADEIDSADQCTAGLNFRTLRPRQDILRGYKKVLEEIYEPRAFFSRVRRLASQLGGDTPKSKFALARAIGDLRAFFGLATYLVTRHPTKVPIFVKTLLQVAIANPPAARYAIDLMVFYFDLGPFSKVVIDALDRQIKELEASAGADEPPQGTIAAAPLATAAG